MPKKTVQLITESQNGYVITVKKNQPTLYNSIQALTKTRPLEAFSWKQTGHGHSVTCRLKKWFAPTSQLKDWMGLSRVISVTRSGLRHHKKFHSETYYITSEAISAYRLSKLIRGHRRIENNLHWVKDVILLEDNSGIRQPNQAATLSIIRNMAINLLVMTGFKSITAGISQLEGKIDQLWEIITTSTQIVSCFSFS